MKSIRIKNAKFNYSEIINFQSLKIVLFGVKYINYLLVIENNIT